MALNGLQPFSKLGLGSSNNHSAVAVLIIVYHSNIAVAIAAVAAATQEGTSVMCSKLVRISCIPANWPTNPKPWALKPTLKP